MKIAISHRKDSFSEHWLNYCKENNVEFKLVDCYNSEIVDDLRDCDGLMWHWHHGDPKDVLFARQLIYSLEAMGKKVYPSSSTCWHYDDKVGQKYLLEAIGAPTISSYIFYNKAKALKWVDSTTFPKVFKLRGGAASINVKLVKSREEAKSLIEKAFGQGFSARNRFHEFTDRVRKAKKEKSLSSLNHLIRGVGRLLIPTEFERLNGREKGYIYFQEFMEGNSFDTRVVVIGDKCFTIRRYNRENDFRASGSGRSEHSPELFDKRCLKIAFETSEKLKAQSLAYDFIFDKENNPRIVEVSYAFVTREYPGYWDSELNWHKGTINSQYALMANFIKSVKGEDSVISSTATGSNHH